MNLCACLWDCVARQRYKLVPFDEPLRGLFAIVKRAAQAAFSANLAYFALKNAALRPTNGWQGKAAGHF